MPIIICQRVVLKFLGDLKQLYKWRHRLLFYGHYLDILDVSAIKHDKLS